MYMISVSHRVAAHKQSSQSTRRRVLMASEDLCGCDETHGEVGCDVMSYSNAPSYKHHTHMTPPVTALSLKGGNYANLMLLFFWVGLGDSLYFMF